MKRFFHADRIPFCRGAAAAALALALSGLAPPAGADCTGTQLTLQRPNAIDYVCRANCGAVPNALAKPERRECGSR